MQRERDRPGAIVAAVIEGSVPATPDVGLSAQRIHRPDRRPHIRRRTRRRVGNPITQNRSTSADRRSIHARLVVGFLNSRSRLALFIRIGLIHNFRAQNVCWFRARGRRRLIHARRIRREPDRFHSHRGRYARDILNNWRCDSTHHGMGKRERLQCYNHVGPPLSLRRLRLRRGKTAEKNCERETNQNNSAASRATISTTPRF